MRVLALLLALVTVCGCSGKNADSDTNAETVGETQGENETVQDVLSLTLNSAELTEDELIVYCTPSRDFSGKITLSTSGGENGSNEGEFKASEKYAVSLGKGKSSIGNTFSVTVTAYGERNDVADELKYEYKNGLPQLSRDNVEIVLSALTLEEKASLCINFGSDTYSSETYEVERLGIPSITMSDGPTGVRLSNGKSAFAYPTPSSLAQTWNTTLISEIAGYMAEDFANYGVDVMLAPGVNIQKNTLNGRNFEYFSEDPYLSGKAATAYINAAQAKGVGVSLKHFIGNEQETSRGVTDSLITERALREIYVKAFEYAIDANPWTVMTSYNKLNGKYTSTRADLVTTLLRGELGFCGAVTSDWGASGGREGMINAGNDLFSGGADNEGDAEEIVKLVNKGKITEEQLNFCVKNVLSLVVKTKKFSSDDDNASFELANRVAGSTVAREAAAESMVLLKNDGALPFVSGNVALFGNASVHTLIGGHGSSNVTTTGAVSVKSGLSKKSGITLNSVTNALYRDCKAHPYSSSSNESNPENDTLEIAVSAEQAKEIAAKADIAIMTVSRLSIEGVDHENRKGDYRLNDVEAQTLKNVSDAFHAAGKKVVVLINAGIPIETVSWQDSVDAIVNIGVSGEQIGNAVADIITGSVNPSGKLAETWPKCIEDTPASDYFPGSSSATVYYDDIYVGYRYYSTFDKEVAYPFGYGMSYTSFEYSDFKLSGDTFTDTITASVTVKNTGAVAGKETVQFYVSKPDGVNEQAKYELCGFGKTLELKPGQSETITVTVSRDELKTYITADSDWVIEAGEYRISVAASVADIKDSKTFKVNEKILVLDTENLCVPEKHINTITKETGKQSVDDVSGENIALGKSASATVTENPQYAAENAFDGDMSTRWSGPNGSVTVDLENEYELSKIRIFWESNLAGTYKVSVSSDGKKWTEYDCNVSYAKSDIVNLDGIKARYVKISTKKSDWFSIYECEIYAK